MSGFAVFSAALLPLFIITVLIYGSFKGIKIYEAFVTGARHGFGVAARLVPFLLAVFLAVGLFRDSGAMNLLAAILKPALSFLRIPVDLIPMAVVRPLSGSASLGVLADILKQNGPDSPTGFIASVIQGSTETTFYVLTVYFGAVGIKEYRHTLHAGLATDVAAFIGSILIARLFL